MNGILKKYVAGYNYKEAIPTLYNALVQSPWKVLFRQHKRIKCAGPFKEYRFSRNFLNTHIFCLWFCYDCHFNTVNNSKDSHRGEFTNQLARVRSALETLLVGVWANQTQKLSGIFYWIELCNSAVQKVWNETVSAPLHICQQEINSGKQNPSFILHPLIVRIHRTKQGRIQNFFDVDRTGWIRIEDLVFLFLLQKKLEFLKDSYSCSLATSLQFNWDYYINDQKLETL